jgi:RNA polymerase sigma factor (TIGR02999 family)
MWQRSAQTPPDPPQREPGSQSIPGSGSQRSLKLPFARFTDRMRQSAGSKRDAADDVLSLQSSKLKDGARYNRGHSSVSSKKAALVSDVTRILQAIEAGDPKAAEELLPLVYDELRRLAAAKMAQEQPGQTLQATALVHDAYLRLVDVHQARHWNSRGHFFSAAAEAMRRILINRARDKHRQKRGGGRRRIDFDKLQLSGEVPDDELLDVDEALQRLAAEDPACAEFVKLRFFAGLTLVDAAHAMGISRRVADRLWAFARAWLYDDLRKGEQSPDF